MWGFHDGMGWWMVFGGMWSLAFLAIVIWLAMWGFSRLDRERPRPHQTPLEIARERLARGEITPEQFEEIRKALE